MYVFLLIEHVSPLNSFEDVSNVIQCFFLNYPVTETSKKRKSGELAADLPLPKTKKKRVSFGLNLSPELFDKRLPPDSPLRKGATPRRSLCLVKRKQSLLRRASVIGLVKVRLGHRMEASLDYNGCRLMIV